MRHLLTLENLDRATITRLLDPSAGTGDLLDAVEQVKRVRRSSDCVELDPERFMLNDARMTRIPRPR